MHNTLKLCSIRNCAEIHEDGLPEGFNPCSVFKELETGVWYYEADATRVVPIQIGKDEFFDAPEWLEQTYMKYLRVWNENMKVCEKPRKRKKYKSTPAAKSPEYTAKELDMMVDAHLRSRKTHQKLKRKLRSLNRTRSGIKRFISKIGSNDLIDAQLNDVDNEIAEIKDELSKYSSNPASKKHSQQSNKWARKWVKPKGRTGDVVYIYSVNNTVYEINRNGIKVNAEYVYLPNFDMRYFESMTWAEDNLGIERSKWIKTCLDNERIGDAIKKYGKKNANGARIRKMFEEKQFEEEALQFKWSLVKQGFSLYNLHNDNFYRERYEKFVKDKLR